MSTTIQFKRGNTAAIDGITPESGEPIWDTEAKKLRVGDGSTAGGIKVAMEGNLILDNALGDGEYFGIVESGVAGAALAVGNIIYLAVADSRWELAKANVAATSKGKVGICVKAAAGDGNDTVILLWGKVRADAVFPALTIGAPVFISAATAGEITSTAPTGTTGFVVRIIGYGNTADELYFIPDNTYLELA